MTKPKEHEHKCRDCNCNSWFKCEQSSRADYCPTCLSKRMSAFRKGKGREAGYIPGSED